MKRAFASVVVVAVALWTGFLFGQVFHAQKVAPRIKGLESDLRLARKLAANCHRMVADHWESTHLEIPGSAETVMASRLLIEDLEQ